MKLSSTLDIPMEQLITLTVEKPQMHGGKPTDRTYLEKNLPASLDKALREYIQGEKDKCLIWTACGENYIARSIPINGAMPSRRSRQTIFVQNIYEGVRTCD